MTTPPAILELRAVTVETAPVYHSGVWNVSLALRPGEMALVRLERGSPSLPIADVAQGLIDPHEGSVEFRGTDWRALSPAAAATQRGRIGRVFEGVGWVSNLDVDENVVLSQRHHTARTEADVSNEAAKLARMFGLPGLPRGRPASVRAADLQRAACVRAFIGTPELLILERPTLGVYPELMPPLMHAVRAARGRGAAVLWFTDEPGIWADRGIKPTLRGVMTGSQMLVSPGDDQPKPQATAAEA